jgi:hypothetical protein
MLTERHVHRNQHVSRFLVSLWRPPAAPTNLKQQLNLANNLLLDYVPHLNSMDGI